MYRIIAVMGAGTPRRFATSSKSQPLREKELTRLGGLVTGLKAPVEETNKAIETAENFMVTKGMTSMALLQSAVGCRMCQ
jgi:hypothetical protein